MIKKISKKVKKGRKFAFIDTSVFLNILYSDFSLEIIDKLNKELNNDKIFLIFPVVILREIQKDFEFWKKELLSSIENQIAIEYILGITDKEKTGGKGSKNKNTNSLLIDKITKEDRQNIIKTVKVFYENIEKNINSIFQHKNTKILELNNDIILKGIERSLMKKAPSTKLDKKTESQHLKDVDCIAFETLLNFFNSETIMKDDMFYLITDDDDYKTSDDNCLRDDLIQDLSKFNKVNIKYCQSIDDIFSLRSKQEKKDSPISISDSEVKKGLIESSKNYNLN